MVTASGTLLRSAGANLRVVSWAASPSTLDSLGRIQPLFESQQDHHHRRHCQPEGQQRTVLQWCNQPTPTTFATTTITTTMAAVTTPPPPPPSSTLSIDQPLLLPTKRTHHAPPTRPPTDRNRPRTTYHTVFTSNERTAWPVSPPPPPRRWLS